MATAQSSPPSPLWSQTLFRIAAVWSIFAMGLQPLANTLYTSFRLAATNNRNLDQSYAPPIGYIQPAAQETNSMTYNMQIQSFPSISESSALGPIIEASGKPESLGGSEERQSTSTGSSIHNSSYMPVVVQATDIGSIPPHVINHHVVNMNGRQQLGQGEKVIVVGQPKCATSSITKFFAKSKKFRACHYACAIPLDPNGYGTYNNITVGRYLGVCMGEAKAKNLPLIKTCGDYDMIGQMDFHKGVKTCVIPQITMLNELHNEHPDATFILNLRHVERWISSVQRWKRMADRLAKCEMGPVNAKGRYLREWYHEHTLRIRQFVTDHPTHALVEIDAESPDTGPRMAAIFGLSEEFWGVHNANPEVLNATVNSDNSVTSS